MEFKLLLMYFIQLNAMPLCQGPDGQSQGLPSKPRPGTKIFPQGHLKDKDNNTGSVC